MPDELVYVLRRGPAYKIGRTRNLSNRLKSLRTGSPDPIVVVFQFRTADSLGLERYLHRLVRHVRRRGERFRLSESQLEMILALRTWPLPKRLRHRFHERGVTAARGLGGRGRNV